MGSVTYSAPSGPIVLPDAKPLPNVASVVTSGPAGGVVEPAEAGITDVTSPTAASVTRRSILILILLPSSVGQPHRWASVRVDAEAELGDELVGEQRVARMEATHPHVAEELFDAVALERTGSAAQVERTVDDVVGVVDDDVAGTDDPHRPVGVVDALRPVLRRSLEQRLGGVVGHAHFGHVVLDLGVVRHRVGEGDGRPPWHLLQRHVEGPLRRAEVDRSKAEQRPGEDRHVERAGAGEARRAHEGDQIVGDEHLVEHGVLALRRPHAERVPGLDDLHTGSGREG